MGLRDRQWKRFVNAPDPELLSELYEPAVASLALKTTSVAESEVIWMNTSLSVASGSQLPVKLAAELEVVPRRIGNTAPVPVRTGTSQ